MLFRLPFIYKNLPIYAPKLPKFEAKRTEHHCTLGNCYCLITRHLLAVMSATIGIEKNKKENVLHERT